MYKPYGKVEVNAGSVVINNWRMPGQYFDAETGLHYNYHRYYDATIGRYLTPDPIGLDGGINLYAYTSNNPVNSIDPYGLIKWESVAKGGSAIVFGAASVFVGSAASATGVGAVVGVPVAIGGSASFGWGVTELIAGLMDNSTGVPTPNAAALATLAATGDYALAADASLAQDLVTAAIVPTTGLWVKGLSGSYIHATDLIVPLISVDYFGTQVLCQ